MALIATGSNKEFKPVPEGTHMALCYRIIDLGTQQWEYQGEQQIGRKVLIGWELHGNDDEDNPLTTDDGRPLAMSKQFTLSLSKKAALRSVLESWRSKSFTDAELAGFDIAQVLGVPCMLTVKHESKNGKVYANVATVSKFPASMKAMRPTPKNPLQMFDLTEPDMQVYDTLPEWVTDIINKSMEHSKKAAPVKTNKPTSSHADEIIPLNDMESDIPF
jgi:hypothetical protein